MRSRSRRRPQVFKQMNRLSALLAQWHDPWVHRLQSKASLGSSHSHSAWRERLRMTAMADERAFVLYDWMAAYGAEPTLERPTDDACERRFVADFCRWRR